MQLQRNEIMTGLLVVGTVAVITAVLILLGAPGLFRPLVTYKVYFDNAAEIKLGAPVMLAGRKIGQVQKLYSPVSREEEQRAREADAAIHPPDPNATPAPASCNWVCLATWRSISRREPTAPAAPEMVKCSPANVFPISAKQQP